jgi:hypothetical protein
LLIKEHQAVTLGKEFGVKDINAVLCERQLNVKI